ncbi:uncharacterized protein LOC135698794 [Ochlerotatus camptorhynchus]|uniref:uncharacterized protein LOC135698794 n=1 Tax=Ochlerotatus camptorhynchus TaxID=644619 RepID=UPI0031D7CF93
MSDVKFVPGLATSLISVGKLVQKNLSVCFGKEDCKIVDSKGDTVVTGARDGGLYRLRAAGAAMKATESRHRENCQHQWHRRLGHRESPAIERILKEILANGIKASTADPCLYVRGGDCKVYLLVYVDDLLVASSSEGEILKIFNSLNVDLDLTSLVSVRHFLGLEVKREQGVFKICLQQYIEKLVSNHGMSDAKGVRSPMDPGYLKCVETGEVLEDATQYRSLVGGLLYLAVVARPDIANTAAVLGRKCCGPTQCDWTAAKRVLRYLKRTSTYFLVAGGNPGQRLNGYSDGDWAGEPDNRESTSGSVFFFGGSAISWASRKQASVTLSSMEAEYVALSEACQEAIWLRKLLSDLGEAQTEPTVIREDNQGYLAFVKSERVSRKSKHIDTRQKFVQELCVKKVIDLVYCPSDCMIADVMTKPLGPTKHTKFCEDLGLQQ